MVLLFIIISLINLSCYFLGYNCVDFQSLFLNDLSFTAIFGYVLFLVYSKYCTYKQEIAFLGGIGILKIVDSQFQLMFKKLYYCLKGTNQVHLEEIFNEEEIDWFEKQNQNYAHKKNKKEELIDKFIICFKDLKGEYSRREKVSMSSNLTTFLNSINHILQLVRDIYRLISSELENNSNTGVRYKSFLSCLSKLKYKFEKFWSSKEKGYWEEDSKIIVEMLEDLKKILPHYNILDYYADKL